MLPAHLPPQPNSHTLQALRPAQQSVRTPTSHPRAAGHVYGKCKPASVGCAALASESEANFETNEKRCPQVGGPWQQAGLLPHGPC